MYPKFIVWNNGKSGVSGVYAYSKKSAITKKTQLTKKYGGRWNIRGL